MCLNIVNMRRGQALIAVLLILGVVVTVSLSIASRSITEVSVSTAQEEAARALAAAEAGVEAKLSGSTLPDAGNVGTSTYTVTLADFGTVNTPLALVQRLTSGESVTVNLAGYTAGSIGVCWSGVGSLETAFYYGSPVVGVERNYYSQDGNCRDVPLTAGSPKQSIRLKLLENGIAADQLTVVPVTSLPKQGDVITAVGRAGESVRKVKVDKQDDRPDIFEAALFSGTSLTK